MSERTDAEYDVLYGFMYWFHFKMFDISDKIDEVIILYIFASEIEVESNLTYLLELSLRNIEIMEILGNCLLFSPIMSFIPSGCHIAKFAQIRNESTEKCSN